MEKKSLEETAAFIREHRGNETHFESLCAKLDEAAAGADEHYKNSLLEIKEKRVDEYRTAKEAGGSTWPEFENFVSDFEKAVVNALSKC